MKKLLILLVAVVSLFFIVNKAEAKWWIFGQGNDEIGFDYLYLNNNSYEELGSKVVLYKDSIHNGTITINGKTSIKKGKVGYVKITNNNKQTWVKAKVSDNGTFTYSFSPEIDAKYQVYIEASDTMGEINKVDETYKEIAVINGSINAKVIETINNVIKAYENEESNLFMTYISSDFAGDSAVLDSAVRKDFNAFDLIKINPYINNITGSSDGKAYVAIQYNRTVVSTRSGQTYTDKGYTEFVLANENGKFKIFSMKTPLLFGLSDAGNVATGSVQSPNNDPILLVDKSGNVNEKPFKIALDIIENDSDIYSDSAATSESVEIKTHTFASPESFDFASENMDMLLQLDISYHYMGGPAVWGYRGTGNFKDLGVCSLNSISSVPAYTEPGYAAGPVFVSLGHCYAFVVGGFTPPYKYAVIKVINNPTMVDPLSIQYKYQPDGTTNF